MSFHNELYDLTENFYSTRNKVLDINEEKNESSAKHVGWQSYESQRQNFEAATNLDRISWTSVDSVLDVGCGYGELVRYLRERKGFKGTYTGVDILDRFIDVANRHHGDDDRNTFICGDILSCSRLSSFYDVVISMGTLSVNYDYPALCGEKTHYFTDNLIKSICNLTRMSAVLYFLNEENITFIEKAVSKNMSFHNSKDIRKMLIHRSNRGYRKLTIASYPDPENVKAIAKIYYI